MNFRKLTPLIFTVAAIAAAISCKKDEESEVMPSLNGTLTFNAPKFIRQKQELEMSPSGITHPDGNGIGYYWKVTPGMSASDTVRLENGLSPDGQESDGSFRYRFSDSLATYTVSCYGFAAGYSTAYTSRLVTVVQGGLDGSITGTGIAASDPRIEYDGDTYHYTSLAGMDWFRNNLSIQASGAPYANCEAMSDVVGRYYSYEEAINACPEGWRLPTDAEWVAMAEALNPGTSVPEYGIIPDIAADLMAAAEFNLTPMWEYWPAVGEITGRSGLAVIPAGYANLGQIGTDGNYPAAAFYGINEYAAFWTADRVEDEKGMAYYRYIIEDQPDMLIGKGDIKTFGASVRCVREK